MKFFVELKRDIGGRALILRWRKSGGKYEYVNSMPHYLKEYFLFKEVPNPNILLALNGEVGGLDEIVKHAKGNDGDRVVKEKRSPLGYSTYLVVEVSVEKPKTPHSEDLSESARDALSKLDAYGHLTYTGNFGSEMDDDWEHRGDLLLAGDFCVFKEGRKTMIAYHVVANSESGGFIMTTEERVVPKSQAPFDLVLSFADMGGDLVMTEAEWRDLRAANDRWNTSLNRELA